MPKSYVREFVENVATSKNALINNLKNKKISADNTMPLSKLVSLVNNIDLKYPNDYYERDPALPDIDEMFDNDPLRSVNGGEYTGCAYIIAKLYGAAQNTVKIGASTSGVVDRLLISDGTDRTNLTTTLNHTCDESGIYSLKDGTKCCLLRFYRIDYAASKQYNPVGSVLGKIEVIDDVMSALNNTYYQGTDYYRFVRSNYDATKAVGLNNLYPNKCFRVDCDFIDSEIRGNVSAFPVLVFNGRYVGTASTLVIGGRAYDTGDSSYINYLKLPETSNPTSIQLVGVFGELYIPDTYTNISRKNNVAAMSERLSKIHIGNGITATTTTICSSASLRDVTCSPNIFSASTSAMTFDLQHSSLLTEQSILNIIEALADRTGMATNTIKFHTNVKTMLTDEQKEQITSKNWTIA